jgi:histidine ammonia-lyase
MTELGVSRPHLAALVNQAIWDDRLELSGQEHSRMLESQRTLQRVVAEGGRVYGVTHGFGPLVAFQASESAEDQGLGLISHLASGQGEPLSPEATRYLLWLRLKGMTKGYSAVAPAFWLKLADLWNRGFTPVVPRDGSISASGDLIPLAHAALAFAGIGQAWLRNGDGWQQVPAQEALKYIEAEPCVWAGRSALAFVNGTSASLAVACLNHGALLAMARCLAAISGRIARLFQSNQQAYAVGVGLVRGQFGQMQAAEWIRQELVAGTPIGQKRPLQEPYSLRCAPQVVGAVLDQLMLQETILFREVTGCTDNPIVYEDEVLHAGNFHAIPVALCSDQQALCLHQLAFLAERQLAIMVDPHFNGNKPPLLTPTPGPQSGFAGVQIAATSLVAKIRQLSYPATLTSLPTNLNNQDNVPMALNGANTVSDLCRYGWLVLASLAMAVTQWSYLDNAEIPANSFWAKLADAFKPLEKDRPLATEVQQIARLLENYFSQNG